MMRANGRTIEEYPHDAIAALRPRITGARPCLLTLLPLGLRR